MKRIGLAVLALVMVAGWVAAAQTDCGCPQVGATVTAPACYESFKSNEIIDFKLIVPAEYFWVHNVSVVPLITAWWVETQEGVVVKYVPFGEPSGHWKTFTWDQSLDAGGYAEPGFYRLVVRTTYDELVTYDIEIVSCCGSPCYAWCCDPCSICDPCVARACGPCCGNLYLTVESSGTRGCCGFGITINAVLGGCCP